MIGAAKADGHIGPEERGLLETELARLSSDASDRSWLEAELARPLDPAAVAQAAATPEMAAEMYLASLLVVDEESFMERAYLDARAPAEAAARSRCNSNSTPRLTPRPSEPAGAAQGGPFRMPASPHSVSSPRPECLGLPLISD